MEVSRTHPLSFCIEELNRDDFLGVGRVLVRFVQVGALDQGLFDARVLGWVRYKRIPVTLKLD